MFKREINPYSVSDKAVFRNVDKTLTLYVRADAASMVLSLKQAQERLKEISDNSDEHERVQAARYFARAVFGEEQGDKLFDFYNDPLAVITAVGVYFKTRLSKKITKAQKK